MISSTNVFSKTSLCVCRHVQHSKGIKESIKFFYVNQSSHSLGVYHHRPAYRLYLCVCLKIVPFIFNLNETYFIIIASFSKCTFQIFFLAYSPFSSAVPFNANVQHTLHWEWR